MGFFADFTVYCWNWVMFGVGGGGVGLCWFLGFWGLLFDDDFGYMTNTCMRMMGPRKMKFPYQYESPFWTSEINFDAQLGQ